MASTWKNTGPPSKSNFSALTGPNIIFSPCSVLSILIHKATGRLVLVSVALKIQRRKQAIQNTCTLRSVNLQLAKAQVHVSSNWQSWVVNSSSRMNGCQPSIKLTTSTASAHLKSRRCWRPWGAGIWSGLSRSIPIYYWASQWSKTRQTLTTKQHSSSLTTVRSSSFKASLSAFKDLAFEILRSSAAIEMQLTLL